MLFILRKLSFEDLVKNGSISFHHKNVHAVKIEMNKVIIGSFPEITNKKTPIAELLQP